MGLFGSLFTAVSGLNAQSEAMGIISNNIANSSTTGYKSNSASFADLVTQADLTNAYDPGGVKTSTVQNVTTQGTVEQTDSNTDLAVSGDGMFVVTSNPNEATLSSPYYTRSGDFSTDSNGNLVNTAGFYLMGWKLDSTGALPADSGSLSSLTPINVDVSSSILQQTSKVSLNMNVDSTQTSMYQNADGSPGATTGTPNYTTQLSVVDSLGTTQTLDVNMTQNYPNAWTMQITGAGANYPTNSTYGVLYNTSGDIQAIGQVTAGASTTATVASSGTAGTTDTSSISGNVMTVTQTVDTGTTATATTTSYTYGSGVVSSGNPATVTLPDMDFGDGSSTTQQVTLDASNFTQFASDSNVASTTSDGIAYGTKTGITIDSNGYVSAEYSNGQVKKIYQVPLATFNSENSLQESTGDVYQQTTGSGTYYLRQADTGGAGTIVPSALEESNVDIATEFSNMIIVQQAYSANSKVISTADQMLSALLQIQTG